MYAPSRRATSVSQYDIFTLTPFNKFNRKFPWTNNKNCGVYIYVCIHNSFWDNEKKWLFAWEIFYTLCLDIWRLIIKMYTATIRFETTNKTKKKIESNSECWTCRTFPVSILELYACVCGGGDGYKKDHHNIEKLMNWQIQSLRGKKKNAEWKRELRQ